MKKLSLIIVTFNSVPLIRECLDSVFKYNDLADELEIIIVDNQSSDQSELFRLVSKEYPTDIILLDAKSNAGYGAGNNLGVRYSTAPHFLVMNPDVRLVKPVFRNLLNVFQQDQLVAMTGVSFSDKSCPFYYKPEFYSLFNLIGYKQKIKKERFDSRKMYLSGSFLMFDKQAFIEAGSFDEKIFLYYEEPDIANRLVQTGRKIFWSKETEVFHMAHNRKYNEKLTRIEHESIFYYAGKYGFSRRKVLMDYLIVFQFKYLVALLAGIKDKKVLFGGWIKLLYSRL